jgi:hypothetical protein
MGASRYGFCSTHYASCHGDGHLSRHRVPDPAAQGQQEKHEGEYQMAHGVMIVGVVRSSMVSVKIGGNYYVFNSSMR